MLSSSSKHGYSSDVCVCKVRKALAAATAAWLAKFYGVAVTEKPVAAATSAPAPAGGVVVILGQDEENSFLGNPGVGN